VAAYVHVNTTRLSGPELHHPTGRHPVLRISSLPTRLKPLNTDAYGVEAIPIDGFTD
jgi:hypothetical protein